MSRVPGVAWAAGLVGCLCGRGWLAFSWCCERYCLVVGEGVFLPPLFFCLPRVSGLFFRGGRRIGGLVIVSSFV